jgi:transcriptional regulator with XRE-family HTH domain
VRGKKSKANQALGQTIRAARHERGLSQEAVAARAGIDRSYYSAIERGEYNVSLDMIFKVSDGLGIRTSELLGRVQL